MTVYECIEFLKSKEEETVIVSLNGIITTQIEMKKIRLIYEEGYLTLEDVEGLVNQIKFNLHQLRKSTLVKENQILLEFEQLQNVRISVK